MKVRGRITLKTHEALIDIEFLREFSIFIALGWLTSEADVGGDVTEHVRTLLTFNSGSIVKGEDLEICASGS